MKFRIVSHACLWVEADGHQLLTDPWLIGSCYWRSWWHAPPARLDVFDPANVNAIYYTHEHPDHLHFPSLRRFPPAVRILVPRFPVDRIRPMLRERGFENVEEIPHAKHAQVGSLEVHSYQFGLDDSAVVITDGTTTLLNLNDSKAAGMALAQVLHHHPRVDFLFRSHAPAQAYPYCYRAEDPADLALLPADYYTKSFAAAAARVRPRWAVPFASNVCHLHPESRDQNAHLVAPEAVESACRGALGASELVVMGPGDGWDRDTGFDIAADAAVRRIPEIVEALGDEKRAKIDSYLVEEAASPAIDAENFGAHLRKFLEATPWILRRMFPFRVAFTLPDGRFLIVDSTRCEVREVETLPANTHSTVRANPHLLRDAVEKYCVNFVGISKRLEVQLHRGGLSPDAAFWGLLAVFELGYLPMRGLLRPRALVAIARRWREWLGYARALARPNRSLESIIDAWDPS